jgi:hypothetical protein
MRDNGTSGSGTDQIEKPSRRGAPAMRGLDKRQEGMFSYVSPEARIPKDHPLRLIREMVDDALKELSADFDVLYSHTGRPSRKTYNTISLGLPPCSC